MNLGTLPAVSDGTTDSVLTLIDTHAHLQIDDFDEDCDELIARQINGIFPEIKGRAIDFTPGQIQVQAAILPGIDLETSRKGLDLAERVPAFRAAVGIHPNHLLLGGDNDWEQVVALSERPDVVAIGETGLDCYWDTVPLAVQIDGFRRHLELARTRRLPVIIHCREAERELMPLLREEVALGRAEQRPLFGVIHSFSGDVAMAEECIDMGFYLGFSGPLTYTNRKFADVWSAARTVPLDRLLLETDAPFLIPHPFRGRLDRNEPILAIYTARRLAELRELSLRELLTQTNANAKRLFSLSPSEF